MSTSPSPRPAEPARGLRLCLPKGRMQGNLQQLLADAGMPVVQTGRDYRPRLLQTDFDVKLLKPQNVVAMLHEGSRDLGFAGADQVAEFAADLVELLDTGLDPVRIIAAAPPALLHDGQLPRRPLRIASEYENLCRAWIERRGCGDRFVRSHGATEAFPPDDADLIVDNTASGETLAQNGLVVVDELYRSSTRLYASRRCVERSECRADLDAFVLLLQSVLAARTRVMLDLNVDQAALSAVIAVLPSMQQPTVAGLHGGHGFAVRAAVPKAQLPRLIPTLRTAGARDLVVTAVAQLVP